MRLPRLCCGAWFLFSTALAFLAVQRVATAQQTGLFGLLWTREDGMWKLVSYQPLNP